MSPVNDQLIRLIKDQPDDASLEEIGREVAFAAMVERVLADSDAGRTISHEALTNVTLKPERP